MKNYYTIQEISDLTGTSKQNIHQIIKRGKIKINIVGKRSILIHRSSYLKYLKSKSNGHSMSNTNFYSVYNNLKRRCSNKNNPNYKYYGARGIKCFWKSFKDFKKDMYEGYLKHKRTNNKNTTIQRIDNNKGYFKDNCSWSTYKEQCKNRRKRKKSINRRPNARHKND